MKYNFHIFQILGAVTCWILSLDVLCLQSQYFEIGLNKQWYFIFEIDALGNF